MTNPFDEEQTDGNGHCWPVYPGDHGSYLCKYCGVGSFALRALCPCSRKLVNKGSRNDETNP